MFIELDIVKSVRKLLFLQIFKVFTSSEELHT